MTPQEFYDSLSADYNILCFVDLADVEDSHTGIYKILAEHYKPAYEPNERLVFYSRYRPLPSLPANLRRATELLDISQDYVIVRCQIDVDSKPLANVDNFVSKNFCPLPWMHLEVSNLGQIRPCCIHNRSAGHIMNTTLSEAFNSDYMNNLRDQFRAGERPGECQTCWTNEDAGLESSRLRQIRLYGRKFHLSAADNPQLHSLDIKPGNVCNFKCRVCGPKSSSLHAAEELGASDNNADQLRNTIEQGQWFDNHDGFINELKELLPTLDHLDLYGGEPFLLKRLPELLNYAVESGHAGHIRLHLNTNGSVFPETLIPVLKQFQHVDIAISIDNTGDRFELERGGAWSAVESNVDRFVAEVADNFYVYIFPTVNVQNVLDLDTLVVWAEQHRLPVTFNYLVAPEELSIGYITADLRDQIVAKYQTHATLKPIAERVQTSTIVDGSKFVELMKKYDQRRQQDFSTTHPEVAKSMGYSV